MANNLLSKPITYIINTAIDTNSFPHRAKQASVTPINKGGNDKHIQTNYRPIRILNTFSKITELAIFDKLTKHANQFLSISVSVYRKIYGTQHELIRFLEEWWKEPDHKQNCPSGWICLKNLILFSIIFWLPKLMLTVLARTS